MAKENTTIVVKDDNSSVWGWLMIAVIVVILCIYWASDGKLLENFADSWKKGLANLMNAEWWRKLFNGELSFFGHDNVDQPSQTNTPFLEGDAYTGNILVSSPGDPGNDSETQNNGDSNNANDWQNFTDLFPWLNNNTNAENKTYPKGFGENMNVINTPPQYMLASVTATQLNSNDPATYYAGFNDGSNQGRYDKSMGFAYNYLSVKEKPGDSYYYNGFSDGYSDNYN